MTRYILIPILSATILTGCDFMLSSSEKLQMELNSWECQMELSPDTTPTQLAEIENNLHSNGYHQVVFRNRYSDSWTPVCIGIVVYATHKPPVQPLPPTTPSTTR